MTCYWCWKRLLVKTIFLHAFGKIATRTKTLLSLYKDVESETNDSVKALLREADNATADTLGDLSYKEMWLPSEQKETRKKALQLKHVVLVSLHKYRERRHAEPGGRELRTHACTRCPVSRKQLKVADASSEVAEMGGDAPARAPAMRSVHGQR